MAQRRFFTWANAVTILGFALTYLIIDAIANDERVIAMLIFIPAALTDFLDGYLARKLNQETAFGKIIDPIRDKCLLLPLLWVDVTLAIVLICFEIISIFFSIVVRWFFGYHVITNVSKVVTGVQMILIPLLFIWPVLTHIVGFLPSVYWIFLILWLSAAIRAVSYLVELRKL